MCEYMCHRMLHPANAVNAQRALATKVPRRHFFSFSWEKQPCGSDTEEGVFDQDHDRNLLQGYTEILDF